MKMTFLGAAHEVTGSCTYLEVGDKKGLVDYGMQQGRDLFENEPIPVPPAELDFVLLTHAHINPDQIEAGTYMIAAAVTNGDVTIHNLNSYPHGTFVSKDA